MTYSFVVIDLENKCDIQNFANYIQNHYKDYEILYCCSTSINIQNVKCFVFNDTNSEKVVNTIIGNATKDKIVLIRKLGSFEEILKLTNELNNNNDVAYLYTNKNKVLKFINNISKKFIKLLFSQDILDVNYNAIAYGESISKVIKSLNSPSMSTRLNSWTGVNSKFVEGGEKYKFNYNKAKCALYTFIPLIITIMLAVVRLVVTVPSFVVSLLIITTGIISFIFFLVFANHWLFRSIVGENESEKAEILNNKGE